MSPPQSRAAVRQHGGWQRGRANLPRGSACARECAQAILRAGARACTVCMRVVAVRVPCVCRGLSTSKSPTFLGLSCICTVPVTRTLIPEWLMLEPGSETQTMHPDTVSCKERRGQHRRGHRRGRRGEAKEGRAKPALQPVLFFVGLPAAQPRSQSRALRRLGLASVRGVGGEAGPHPWPVDAVAALEPDADGHGHRKPPLVGLKVSHTPACPGCWHQHQSISLARH